MTTRDDSQHEKQAEPAVVEKEEATEPGLKDVVRSVLWASIGIQSRRNQERDFKHGKAKVFVIAGIVFTLLFIATVFSIVTVVLKNQ
jgi:hypothetical protein